MIDIKHTILEEKIKGDFAYKTISLKGSKFNNNRDRKEAVKVFNFIFERACYRCALKSNAKQLSHPKVLPIISKVSILKFLTTAETPLFYHIQSIQF